MPMLRSCRNHKFALNGSLCFLRLDKEYFNAKSTSLFKKKYFSTSLALNERKYLTEEIITKVTKSENCHAGQVPTCMCVLLIFARTIQLQPYYHYHTANVQVPLSLECNPFVTFNISIVSFPLFIVVIKVIMSL